MSTWGKIKFTVTSAIVIGSLLWLAFEIVFGG